MSILEQLIQKLVKHKTSTDKKNLLIPLESQLRLLMMQNGFSLENLNAAIKMCREKLRDPKILEVRKNIFTFFGVKEVEHSESELLIKEILEALCFQQFDLIYDYLENHCGDTIPNLKVIKETFLNDKLDWAQDFARALETQHPAMQPMREWLLQRVNARFDINLLPPSQDLETIATAHTKTYDLFELNNYLLNFGCENKLLFFGFLISAKGDVSFLPGSPQHLYLAKERGLIRAGGEITLQVQHGKVYVTGISSEGQKYNCNAHTLVEMRNWLGENMPSWVSNISELYDEAGYHITRSNSYSA